MEQQNPLISVIVPVYNVEQYLVQCVDSILNQKYENFELLLVDDGSTDKSGDICDVYGKKDKRVRVFHKKNGGVGSARNVGIDNAFGEWFVFVDSDDWVKADYFENLLSHVSANIDLIVSFPEVHLKEKVYNIDGYTESIVSKERIDEIFSLFDLQEHTSPWGKLFRASIIKENSIRFNEDMCFGEDTVFLYTFLLIIDSVHISKEVGYCYRGEIEGSLSKRINQIDSEFINYMNVYEIINVLIKQRNITDKESLFKLKSLIAIYIWRTLNSIYHSSISRNKRLQIISSLDMSVLVCKKSMSAKDVILKFILRHKMYRLYDMLRVLTV